ncbi:MAG: hypothetical protein V4501_01655 [Pseudomonadota bacterium]
MLTRRKISFVSFGLASIAVYISWLLRETSQQFTSNLSPNTFPVAVSTVAVSAVASSLYSFFTKPPEKRLVTPESVSEVINYVPQVNYTYSDFIKDANYLTGIVMDIYKNNHINRCMLDYIFRESPEFKFILTNAHAANTTRALYSWDNDAIYMNNYFERSLLDIRKIDVSHELRHAVEALDNYKLKRCLMDDEKHAMPYNYGLFKRCDNDKPALDETLTLMQLDLNRLEFLLKNATRGGSNFEVGSPLDQLKTLLVKYQYKKHHACLKTDKDSLNILAFKIKSKNYIYNDTTKSYKANGDYLQHYVGPQQEGYIIEYNPADASCQVLITYTHPDDKFDYTLITDVLLAVVLRIQQVFNLQNETSHPMEFSCILDEVTAPYTHIIDNDTVTLREWLAPNMHRHELVRASREYRDCVKTSFRR